MQAVFPTDTGLTRRLVIGLLISILLHSVLVFGIKTKTKPGHSVPAPLHVELVTTPGSPPSNIPVIRASAEQPGEPVAVTAGAGVSQQAEQHSAPAPVEAAKQMPYSPYIAPEVGLALDKYYAAREVDVRAEQINEVDLIYPKRAYENRTRGRVVLRIYINEKGGIDEIVVTESVPAGVFEEAALTATLALQFRPAIKNQRNVKSIKTIEIVFNPYESINIP